jgi:predicted transcriptional regulator
MRVTVNIPDDIGETAQHLAEERGQSVSSFYAEAVEQRVKALRREQAVERIDRLIEEHPPPAPDALDELKRMRRASERNFE